MLFQALTHHHPLMIHLQTLTDQMQWRFQFRCPISGVLLFQVFGPLVHNSFEQNEQASVQSVYEASFSEICQVIWQIAAMICTFLHSHTIKQAQLSQSSL